MAENLSGVPPTVTLSGLETGMAGGGFSGASQQGLGPSGSTPFGMEGGLDLSQLMQLLSGQGGGEEAGVGTGGNILQSLAQGSLGQQTGGLSAGSFGQTQPGYVAGQSAAGQGPAQQAAVGATDPLSIVQKFLGLAQKGAGALGSATTTASPTSGGSDLTLNTDLGGTSGTGSPGYSGTASPSIGQDMQGTLGSNLLSDPTLSSLFTTGKLNGWDGSMESLDALMASDPSIRDALFQGTVGGSLGEQLGAGSGGAGGFTLGTGDVAGPTNWLGAAGGAAGAGSGLLSILQGLQGGNAGQAAGGGLQTTAGLVQALKSSPELAQALGITPDMLGGTGAGLQGLGAILNLYQGLQSGNAAQIGQGGIGAAGAAAEGASALGYGGAVTGALGAYLPVVGAILQGLTADMSYKNADATAKQAMISNAIATASALVMANPVGALLGPILGVAMAANQALNPKTNYDLNKLSGQVGPNAVGALNTGAGLFSNLDYSTADTDSLIRALAGGANSLAPQYNAEGTGMGTSGSQTGVSRYVEGLKTADPAGYAQHVANQQAVQSGMVNAIKELMNRGVTYEQLGQIPLAFNPAFQSLAMEDPWSRYAANLSPEMRWDPSLNFEGATLDARGLANGASQFNTVTQAYGGPLWTMLARLGVDPNGIIQQHFDPMRNLRGRSAEDMQQIQQQGQQLENFVNSWNSGGTA